MILSFVLFIFAISFALWFFSPDGGVRRAESSMDYIFREVEDNVSIELITYSIGVDSGAWESEPSTPQVIGVFIEGIDSEMKARARFSDDSLGDVNRNGDSYFISHSDWDSQNLFFLEFSEEFSDGSVSEVTIEEEYYTLGNREVEEVLSEQRLNDLQEAYLLSYNSVKEDFNVYVEFGFRILFSEGDELDVERGIPEGLDVFSEQRRVRVLRNTADQAVEYADMIVRVW